MKNIIIVLFFICILSLIVFGEVSEENLLNTYDWFMKLIEMVSKLIDIAVGLIHVFFSGTIEIGGWIKETGTDIVSGGLEVIDSIVDFFKNLF